jgi:hypothetical protein
MTQPTDYKFVEPGAVVTAKPHNAVVLASFIDAVCTAAVVPMTYEEELAFLATHS